MSKVQKTFLDNIFIKIAFLFLAGMFTGLSAPGILLFGLDLGIFVWFGLAFVLITIFRRYGECIILSFVFFLAYNLVYLNWYLGLAPLDWMGIDSASALFIPYFAWLFESVHQTSIMVLSIIACKFIFEVTKKNLTLNQFLIPLIFVVTYNALNSDILLGVPWSSFEYSQFNNKILIQPIAFCGHEALCFMILVINATIAFNINLNWHRFKNANIHFYATKIINQINIAALLVLAGWIAIGFARYQTKINNKIGINIVFYQPGISCETRYLKKFNRLDCIKKNLELLKQSKNCLIVLPENATPVNLISDKDVANLYTNICQKNNLNIITGSFYFDNKNKKFYNSAYLINKFGVNNNVYHKRILVPFGEYSPDFINYFPKNIKDFTKTASGSQFYPGQVDGNFTIGKIRVNVLICFEVLFSRLINKDSKAKLIINLCDLSWFHNSIIGQQMIAFAILRAVENHKFFIFVSNNGPSAIVDSFGQVLMKTSNSLDKEVVKKYRL